MRFQRKRLLFSTLAQTPKWVGKEKLIYSDRRSHFVSELPKWLARFGIMRRVAFLACWIGLLTSGGWADLFSITDRQAVAAGRRAHTQVMKEYGAWKDPQQQARIDRLGGELANFSERPDINYKFYLLDTGILNALATPDGSIHVTRGLATAFKDDKELQFILGHELTHVERRHGKQMIETAMKSQLGGNLLLIALGRRDNLTRFGVGGLVNWLNMKYSRDHETEADEGGMRLLQKFGVDPAYGPKALQHLFQLGKSSPGLMTKYFGTHPMPEERVQHAKEFAQKLISSPEHPASTNPQTTPSTSP